MSLKSSCFLTPCWDKLFDSGKLHTLWNKAEAINQIFNYIVTEHTVIKLLTNNGKESPVTQAIENTKTQRAALNLTSSSLSGSVWRSLEWICTKKLRIWKPSSPFPRRLPVTDIPKPWSRLTCQLPPLCILGKRAPFLSPFRFASFFTWSPQSKI